MKDETLFLYLNDELDKHEQSKVEEWLEKNPEKYQEIKTIWEESKLDASGYKPDVNSMWNNVTSAIDHSDNRKKVKKMPVYKTLLRYAAIFIIGIGILGYLANQKINHIEWLQYTADNTAKKEVVLPDGSIVTLNKASSVEYKKAFRSKNREINLEGEAFFQVKRNPEKPFIVNLKNTRVRVLGTSFNVNATEPSGNVVVSVESGKVMFYDKSDTSNVVYLTKGNKGVFASHGKKIKQSTIHNNNYLAWKTGILLFKNQTLPEVCDALGKHFNTIIEIDNPALNTKKLTARYQNKSLSEVLELLKIALDVEYMQKNGKILLTSK